MICQKGLNQRGGSERLHSSPPWGQFCLFLFEILIESPADGIDGFMQKPGFVVIC